jgi:hypothetical protein
LAVTVKFQSTICVGSVNDPMNPSVVSVPTTELATFMTSLMCRR